jgi:hypothetical protein
MGRNRDRFFVFSHTHNTLRHLEIIFVIPQIWGDLSLARKGKTDKFSPIKGRYPQFLAGYPQFLAFPAVSVSAGTAQM